jgi:hypothetical protein
MLNHPTLDQLKALKFDGMAEAFTELETQDGTASLSHAEWLGLLIDRETTSRETKRFESRMRSAKLRHVGASPGVCQTSCPPISCSVSNFRDANFVFGVEPNWSGRLPVSGFS